MRIRNWLIPNGIFRIKRKLMVKIEISKPRYFAIELGTLGQTSFCKYIPRATIHIINIIISSLLWMTKLNKWNKLQSRSHPCLFYLLIVSWFISAILLTFCNAWLTWFISRFELLKFFGMFNTYWLLRTWMSGSNLALNFNRLEGLLVFYS